MASNGSMADRTSRSRISENGFAWVSSSPSPVEVASLEARFSEVVRIPESELQEEMAGWQHHAVLTRSFSKWVPIEAYIREFRRAGIAGAIVPVSLAFRCCIFRFEDPAVCEMVLNRPWVINGQIIATEAWQPEFFPAKNSVSSALVWMRLPNLPMEFWKVNTLKVITEQAGSFLCADAATLAKNRGGYARVAVRVDLRCPLRPGTRVQGLRGPFWQQFAFEALEGFCLKCGSLHLDGLCTEEAMAEKADAGGSFVFGPWLAAVRQRRSPAAPSGKQASSMGKPSSNASVPSSFPRPVAPDVSQMEGWKSPAKLSRRRPSGSVNTVSTQHDLVGGKSGEGSASESGLQVDVGKKGQEKGKNLMVSAEGEMEPSPLVAVPVLHGRAGFKKAERDILQTDNMIGASESVKLQSLITDNPFAALELASNDVDHKESCVLVSGPHKRARPADCLPPRSIPKLDKRKGKGKSKMVNCRVDFIPSSHGLPSPSCGQASGREELMVISVSPVDHEREPPSAVSLGQGLSNTVADPGAPHDGSVQNEVDGSVSAGHHLDSLMLEDQVAVPTTSN